MTAEGYTKITRWIKKINLWSIGPKIIEAIAEARSHGDLSENAEYQYAKNTKFNWRKNYRFRECY